jgi:hypothetical protein
VFKDKKLRKAKKCCWFEERRTTEEINGGNNSIDLEDTYLAKRAIQIHGRMERNLAKYAKYYSYGSIKILRGSEFKRKNDYNKKGFSKYW